MDSKRLVSLESFKAAHCSQEDDGQASCDCSGSEIEEDDASEWLFSEDRKRKGREKEVTKRKPKKITTKRVVDDEDWTTSAKIEKLSEILREIRSNDAKEKVIVFSQVIPFFPLLI
jgi:hypothetical protein